MYNQLPPGGLILEGEEAFNALAFGAPSAASLEYFRKEHQRGLETIQYMPVHLQQSALEFSMRQYNRFLSDESSRRIKATLEQAGLITGMQESIVIQATHIFLPLGTVPEFQQASPEYQPYILACPEVKDLYNRQQIDGYSDTYLPKEPDTFAETDIYYRQVVAGTSELLYTPFEDTETNYTSNPLNYLPNDIILPPLEFYKELTPSEPYFVSEIDTNGSAVIRDVMAEFKRNQELGVQDHLNDPRVPFALVTTHDYFLDYDLESQGIPTLEPHEQSAVLDTWHNVRLLLGDRADPTNPLGGYRH